jgi:hypothetical protein
MVKNAFLEMVVKEPPPESSLKNARELCPPNLGGHTPASRIAVADNISYRAQAPKALTWLFDVEQNCVSNLERRSKAPKASTLSL